MDQTTSNPTEAVWDRVQEALNDLDFPAAKDDIVAHAQERGGDGDVLKMLRAIPVDTYRNISELRSSVRLDPDERDLG